MKVIIPIFFFLVSTTNLLSQCNGSYLLCHKRYNEVAYLTTHNSFNSTAGNFSFPNQTYNILDQLNSGVRALMIDVYDDSGTPVVYHSFPLLGSINLLDIFIDIKYFLDHNPNEILTIIFESYTDANSIENEINSSGLDSYLYSKDSSSLWSTLENMINSNERLIIFSDVDDASFNQSWYHYIWDYAVETHFSVANINDFNCDYNRGDSLNDLFIFNHFLTDAMFGYGLYSESAIVNTDSFFLNRVLNCQSQKSKFPNFLTVDFFELGDCMSVTEQINSLYTTVEDINSHNKSLVYIFDIMGNYSIPKSGELLFYYYDDGSIDKKILFD
tara:strand:+ start:1242 stop:2228 length:987 start_codon:yes stop_codon:yes gene_type:complete